MTAAIERIYRDYRRRGYRPPHALRTAKTASRFQRAEAAGLVRLRRVPDELCNLADLEGDCFDEALNAPSVPGGVRTIRAERSAFRRQIDRYGVFGLVGEYRVHPEGSWIHADSVWGFVASSAGDLEEDTGGCASDIMSGTLAALRDALASRCPCCRQVRPARKDVKP